MAAGEKPVKKGLLVLYVVITLLLAAFVGGYIMIDAYYPLKYKDIVLECAKENGLDPCLVFAVAATESKFDPQIVSKKGAVGIMQILPETGDWIAGKLGMDDFSADMLREPEVNIRMGAWYLRFLIDRYGSRNAAVAAYNAGHGNVDNWIDSGGGELKDIPFEETENYVKKVARAYEIYKNIYQVG